MGLTDTLLFAACLTYAVVGAVVASRHSHNSVGWRKLAWISGASGIALIGAIVVGVGLQVSVAFVLLVLGLLLSYVVIAASAIRVLRLAGATGLTIASSPKGGRDETAGTSPRTVGAKKER